jgi:hypothetical protein
MDGRRGYRRAIRRNGKCTNPRAWCNQAKRVAADLGGRASGSSTAAVDLDEQAGSWRARDGSPYRVTVSAAGCRASARNTEGGLFDGKKAAAVPEYEFRLTGEVDIPAVPGLTITSAVFHSGPAPYDNLNSFNVPAWTRADLGARYVYWIDKTKMTGRFNVENLTDEAYWIAGYGSGGLAQSGARRYLASLTASF